jgi:hypothetical protein
MLLLTLIQTYSRPICLVNGAYNIIFAFFIPLKSQIYVMFQSESIVNKISIIRN